MLKEIILFSILQIQIIQLIITYISIFYIVRFNFFNDKYKLCIREQLSLIGFIIFLIFLSSILIHNIKTMFLLII